MLFAITDIETTGSHASGNSITEIGVCLHDGEKVLREFHTLLNPGVNVPQYITTLTGITNDMLKDAPTFSEIAEELLGILEGAVFVAHNVQFDYSFIRAEFNAINIKWQSRRLCTVKLARKAFPGAPSYGLGNICSWLGIHNEQAHRALSDARAAVQVFEKSKNVLEENVLLKMISHGAPEVFLPPHLPVGEFEALPQTAGVYYMLDEKGKAIYIGKAKNIKKRVQQHFTSKPETKRLQDFMKEIHHVTYEPTGTELIALLLEDAEIRQHWPRHNAAQKNRVKKQSIIRYTDQRGYERLAISNSVAATDAVKTFSSAYRAREWLMQMAKEFSLDMRLLGLDMFDVNAPLPESDDHNNTLQQALEAMMRREPNFFIRGKGRHDDEVSYVIVLNGILYGYAFANSDENQITQIIATAKRLPASETNAAIIRNFCENPQDHRLMHLPSIDYLEEYI